MLCIIVITTCFQLYSYSDNDTMRMVNTSITTDNAVGEQHLIVDVVDDYDVASRSETVDVQNSHATRSSTLEFISNPSTSATTDQDVGASTNTTQSSNRKPTTPFKLSNSTDDNVNSTTRLHRTKPHDMLDDFHGVAINPIPIYTKELAMLATRPSSWQCTADPALASDNGTIVAFVHVYKAAGTTIRQFFHELAFSCHRTWVSLARCTGVLPSTIQSRKDWKPCAIEEVADGRRQKKEQYMYPTAKNFKRKYQFPISNPSFEKFVDIYGGHARLGTGDNIYPNSRPNSQSVRYIVFLRDPIERYVSGLLYQNKVHRREETLEKIVNKVKSRIAAERREDRYWDKSLSYLLTPEQRVAEYHFTIEQLKMLESNGSIPPNAKLSSLNAEAKAKLAIHNLYEYNAIIGMTERMSESLDILRRVLLNGPENPQKAKAQAVFTKFDPTSSQSEGVTANKSVKREVSTSAVVAELAKDEEHMNLFLEYVKYERMITDFAWTMHNLQYDCVTGIDGGLLAELGTKETRG